MIFVDTSAWYAALIQEDLSHDACRDLLTESMGNLLTTDYIVDELLTLLTVRGHRDVAKRIGPRMWRAEITNLHWITPEDVDAAWKVFTDFDDKSWSFTDCTSHAIMRRLGIVEALTLDEHFRQFGFATIRPRSSVGCSKNGPHNSDEETLRRRPLSGVAFKKLCLSFGDPFLKLLLQIFAGTTKWSP